MKKLCPFGGKVAFSSERLAKHARNTIGARRKKGIRVYRCPNCHDYHLTSAKR
jgi:hypothetical protein